jgi:aminomuconate-semialdehyde/2-hydroxymuconate-6-semialdehyde dehydrogenase
MSEKILNFIGGELRPSLSGQFLENFNPARGEVYSLVADSNEADVNAAVLAAEKAFPAWSKMPALERAQHLRRLAQKIGENVERFAKAESIDNGKPLSLCRNLDIPRCSMNFEFFADSITQFHSETFMTDQRALNYTTHTPLGVVGCISPWNLPLYSLTWKIAPALAMGNTVVAKPSEMTPMTAFMMCQLMQEIGFPAGVLNIVHGLGKKVGDALVKHPKVKAISFTGSTLTGRSIAQATAATFKKVSLEMGGKNANIIFADADFEKAIEGTLRSSFLNQGQVCLCGSRIFVEKSIYNKFRDELVARTQKLKSGNPLDESTDQGALVSEAHFKKVLSYIELAKQEGGKILCGGGPADLGGENAKGYFVKPTLIEGLAHTCRTNQEEIFGPVATLIPFETESEVVSMANSTVYGLSASVWTSHIDRGHRVAGQIDAGVVWVNTWMLRDLRTPFGGMKESGIGREGGREALTFFSEIKNICVALNP